MEKNYIAVNYDVAPQGIRHIHPEIFNIIYHVYHWCKERKITFVIADLLSTLQRDIELNRISTTHRQGRAFDISFKEEYGWTKDLIKEFENFIYEKFSHVGALKNINNELVSRPIKVHENSNKKGIHGHIQVRP